MTNPIPTEAIRDITWIAEVSVSPDGETVAFIGREFDGEEDETYTSIFTVPTDGSEAPYRLTRLPGASSPKWSPGGEMLAFLASREEDVDRRVIREDPTDDEDDKDEDNADGNGNGNDEPETQVWAFDLDRGGDARQLTDRDHGVREFDWGPEGDRIVISARDPTAEQQEYLERREDGGPIEIERLQHRADGVGFTDDVTTYLFIYDLETGNEHRLDEAYGAGALEPLSGLQPAWHPGDERIAYLTCPDERADDSAVMDVHLVDVESGERTRLTDEAYMLSDPDWSPSGNRLVVSGRPADNWYDPGDVFLVEPADDVVTILTKEFEPTVSRFASPRFADDDVVLGGFGNRGHSSLYRIEVDGQGPTEIPDLVSRNQSVRRFAVGGDTLAVSLDNPGDGHDIFTLEGLRDRPNRVTELNRSFVDEHPMPGFTRIETVTDDETIESLVYYPDSFDPDDPTPHPVIIWTHGGPMSYDDPTFRFDFLYFTSQGYVICKPNYRGSTSYGTAFAEALRGKWGTIEVDDVLAVTDDLETRGIVDSDRLFATGFSYGGILTGYLVTRTDRFTAAAAEHGIYDLRSDFGAGDSQVWMSQEFGLPWEETEAYDAGSSLLDVGGVDTPTLVTAGGEDWRCPPHQSEQFYVAIKKQAVPAKLIVYPNENHTVGTPERAIHRLEALATWFDRHDPTTEESD